MSIFVLLFACILRAPITDQTDSNQIEIKQWQGHWKIKQLEVINGKKIARLRFADDADASWEMKQDQLTLVGMEVAMNQARITFKPHMKNKIIIKFFDKDNKNGPVVEGIYSRTGDTGTIEVPQWPINQAGQLSHIKLTLSRIKK